MSGLQIREVLRDQSLNACRMEEWCFRGRNSLTMSEPRRERGIRKGEINVPERGGLPGGKVTGRH